MATYATLRNGSSGEDVKKLQQALTNAGYNTGGVDGIFGANTESALKQYQTANGLTADGVAGDQTFGKLYGMSQGTGGAEQGKTAMDIAVNQPRDYSGYSYRPDSGAAQKYMYNAETDGAYQAAMAALNEAQKNRPAYQATYDGDIQAAYQRIMSRKPFSYDPETDPAYQQYRSQYISQGQQAMRDTVAQGAALTGGYGNTYAQSAGQQAYDAYLQRLNDVLPQLRSEARQAYNDEGNDLYRQFSMMRDLGETEYNRSRDALSDWRADRDYAQQRADTLYSRGAENWYQSQSMAADDYYKSYQMGLDAANTAYDRLVSLISATGYSPTDAELQAAGMPRGVADAWKQYYSQQMALAASSGSGGSSGRSSSGKSYSSGGGSGSSTAAVTASTAKTPTSAVTQANSIGSFRQLVEPWRQNENTVYDGWGKSQWQSFFAQIRKEEGRDAAVAEMNRLINNGQLPQSMRVAAAQGAMG